MSKGALQHRKNPRRVPITWALVISIGLLMLIAIGGVLAIGVWAAQKNTVDLLGQSAHQTVAAASDKVKAHLKPAEFQAKFIADWLARKEISPDKPLEFEKILIAALAAAPQIEAILFIDTKMQSIGAGHEDGVVGLSRVDYAHDRHIVEAMKNVAAGPRWGAPIWRERYKKTYLNYAYPVFVDDKFIGAIVTIVSIKELSRFVSQGEVIKAGQQFLLYGQDRILAHWMLENSNAHSSQENPLPQLSSFSDPILSAIWRVEGRQALDIPLPNETRGHLLEAFNKQFIFIYRHLKGFGPAPIIVGVYFHGADVNKEIERLVISLIAGMLALGVALIIMVIIGRKITQPIVHFSTVAKRVQHLEIAKVGYLPGSIFREIDDQSTAFNSMLQALHWFELYVPKKIVESLIKRNIRVGDDISDIQNITVMFTDIVGFSPASEGMSAQEVAKFVNEHFTLVAECIEAEDGIVDKFIGDSVMAFWGAPDIQLDSADRACRAALAIAAAIHTDNEKRVLQAKATVRIRIGIHSGTAVIGNIGSPGRLNYTIIGDTVNIAQRLEQLGKEVGSSDSEATILLSENTAKLLSDDLEVTSAGRFALKGHAVEIEVYKLL